MLCTIASKNKVGINFIKGVKNLYAEDYKKMLREIKIKVNGKISYVYGLKSLTHCSDSNNPQIDYRFGAIPIGIQAGFAEIEKLIQKLIWKLKEPTIAKTILKKRNIVGRLILSNYKTYYKAIIIKGVIPA